MGIGQEPWSQGELDHLFIVTANVWNEGGLKAVLDLLLGLDVHAHTLPYCSWSKAETDAQVYIHVQLCTPVQLLSRSGNLCAEAQHIKLSFAAMSSWTELLRPYQTHIACMLCLPTSVSGLLTCLVIVMSVSMSPLNGWLVLD